MRQFSIAAALFCLTIMLAVSGCGNSVDAEKIAAARLNLQLAEPQKTIDGLAELEPSAEYHYLKAIALDRLNRPGPAMAEIDFALETEPDVPKYKGLKLKFLLFQTNVEAIGQMIQLHEDNTSNPSVSLFSIYAYQAKTLRLAKLRKVRAAAAHRRRANDALVVCVRLIAEIPEFHTDVLNFAIQNGLKKDAELLADQLLELDPDNPNLARYKLEILVLAEKFDKAAEMARSIYHKNDRSELAAVLYSQILSQAKANKDYDREMRDLVQDHPRSVDTVTNYAIYLARSDRMAEAIKVTEYAIRQHKLIAPRSQLISTAISLPLEAGDAVLAQHELERYRQQLSDTYLIRLFEGRIHYLNKNYGEALDKLQSIVMADRREVGSARLLASEALKWIRTILNDEAVITQMKRAADDVKKLNLRIDLAQPDGDGKSKTGDSKKHGETKNESETKVDADAKNAGSDE